MEKPRDPSLYGAKVEFEGVIKKDRPESVPGPTAAGEESPFKDATGPLGEVLRTQPIEIQQAAAQLLNRAGYGETDVRLITGREDAGRCLSLVNEYIERNKNNDAAGVKETARRLQEIMDQ